MEDDSLPPQRNDVEIIPLESKGPDGKPWERPGPVLDGLAEALPMSQAERLANLPRWRTGVIVYLIVHTTRGEEEYSLALVQEAIKRGTRIARACVRGMGRTVGEEIVEEVQGKILELILTRGPSSKREFLEIAFTKAVEGYTFNRVRDHLRSPLRGRRVFLPEIDEDGNDAEQPLDLLASADPGPEDQLLILRDRNERHRLLRIACQAVDDRQVLKALILHHGYGWPVMSTDGNIPCLCRHFKVPERSMYRMLGAGISAMRKALNVELPLKTRAAAAGQRGEAQ